MISGYHFFFVTAQHWQVGLHVHRIVDAFLKCSQPHFMHLIQHVTLAEACSECARASCLECQLFEGGRSFDNSFIINLFDFTSTEFFFVLFHLLQLNSCLITQLYHFLAIKWVIWWSLLMSRDSC